MWKTAVTKPVLVLAVFGAYGMAAWADEDAEKIINASHECVSGRSFERRDTAEQKARLLIPGKPPMEVPSTKQTSIFEVDTANKLVRMTVKDKGKDVVVIRQGKKSAMKIDTDPWSKPQGPYARMDDQLANPFACPLPKKGDKDSPKWRIVGREVLDGEETTVIETVGDTANKFAAERMREGLVAMFPEADKRPSIEVLDYKSRHWIGKDNRRLRVEQTSHSKMTMPGTSPVVIDLAVKTITVYSRYDKVQIQVPNEAQAILGSK
jgi:hypothetical protein